MIGALWNMEAVVGPSGCAGSKYIFCISVCRGIDRELNINRQVFPKEVLKIITIKDL